MPLFSYLLMITLIISYLLTGCIKRYAPQMALLDHPNGVSAHDDSMPIGGGIAIVVIFSLSLFLLYPTKLYVLNLLIPAIIIAFTGLLDDRLALSAKTRLALQLLAVFLFLLHLQTPPRFDLQIMIISLPFFSYLFAALGLLWMTNLYNFMDGIDAIAAVEALSVLAMLVFQIYFFKGPTLWIQIFLTLFMAVSGFLFWNWSPAKIFMGDVGSTFIGFLFAAFLLLTINTTPLTLYSWLIALGFFWIDATYTLFYRILSGKRFYQRHRTFLFQILARNWKSHTKVNWLLLAINLLWLLPMSCLSIAFERHALLITISALTPLVAACVHFGAGKETSKPRDEVFK